uniref:Ribulose bisphosphate carboxylase/oxygenase activase, chloroplastic n=1 Tax=Triticum urartu TaxID=4572 RepID=A0A8R7Q1U6_TRIUA
MAAAFSSTVGAPASTPTNFLGKKLKKQVTSAVNYHGKSSKANRFTVMAAENIDEKRNTDMIKKGKMCCLFINDLDAGAGRMGGTTQYTVNNQMVNATLMNIADAPTNVQLPGMYNKEENPRVPIVVTGNDFSTLYAPLIRDGRMEKFYWAPTRDDRIGVCKGIFQTDNVSDESVVKIVDTFPGQSIACCIGGGKGAQQGTLPVPAGCTDQTAKNFDPTARSDDGSCLYTF